MENSNPAMAEEKYKEAEGLTTNASDKDIYKNNQAIALKKQGDALRANNDPASAITKYNEALLKANEQETKDYINDEKAGALNQQGLEFGNNKEYGKAAEKFEAAYQVCTSQTFKDNRDQARAEALNVEGDKLYNSKQYSQAIVKYEEACNKCPKSKAEALNRFKDNISLTEAEILNLEGDKLYNSKQYSQAIAKYEEAYNKCPSSKDSAKNKFKNNEAIALEKQGDALRANNDLESAITKYNESLLKANQQETKDSINNERAGAINDQDFYTKCLTNLKNGLHYISEGKNELAEENFTEALEAFNMAEQEFDNANHEKSFNKILSECYVKLIILYDESGDSDRAQELCLKCYEGIFVNSEYEEIFKNIYENQKEENQIELEEYIAGIGYTQEVVDIEEEVVQLLGSSV